MKIISANADCLKFDNGSCIYTEHEPDCCEENYADFKQVIENNSDIEGYNFSNDLIFEGCDYGFRFGDRPEMMFFVPCYSIQNGFYSQNIDVYYNEQKVLSAYGSLI